MSKVSMIFLVLFGIATTISNAQNDNSKSEGLNKNFGLGFQLGQYQNDFGLGINMTSPFFVYDRLAVRVRGNFMWNEHLDSNVETTWTSYSNLSLGVLGIGREIGDFVRLYGEGGGIFLFPPSELSSNSFEFGGYGLIGFEFFLTRSSNYFIEIGAVGTGAKAEKVATKPIYSNGLLINVGYRFQF